MHLQGSHLRLFQAQYNGKCRSGIQRKPYDQLHIRTRGHARREQTKVFASSVSSKMLNTEFTLCDGEMQSWFVERSGKNFKYMRMTMNHWLNSKIK